MSAFDHLHYIRTDGFSCLQNKNKIFLQFVQVIGNAKDTAFLVKSWNGLWPAYSDTQLPTPPMFFIYLPVVLFKAQMNQTNHKAQTNHTANQTLSHCNPLFRWHTVGLVPPSWSTSAGCLLWVYAASNDDAMDPARSNLQSAPGHSEW